MGIGSRLAIRPKERICVSFQSWRIESPPSRNPDYLRCNGATKWTKGMIWTKWTKPLEEASPTERENRATRSNCRKPFVPLFPSGHRAFGACTTEGTLTVGGCFIAEHRHKPGILNGHVSWVSEPQILRRLMTQDRSWLERFLFPGQDLRAGCLDMDLFSVKYLHCLRSCRTNLCPAKFSYTAETSLYQVRDNLEMDSLGVLEYVNLFAANDVYTV